MTYTVFWYGKKGLLDKTKFDDERTAKSHAIDTYAARKRDFDVVAVKFVRTLQGLSFSAAQGRGHYATHMTLPHKWEPAQIPTGDHHG